MRRLRGMLVVAALAGCNRPHHVDGHHPAPGVTRGDIDVDDDVYDCGDSERCIHARVLYIGYPEVHLIHGKALPGRIVPLSRLAVGDVVERKTDRQWFVVTAIGTAITAGDQTFAPDEILIPTAQAEAYDRHLRRVWIAVGVLFTALAIAVLLLARWLRDHVADLRRAASRGVLASPASVAAAPDDAHAVLRCDRCATPVTLAATPVVPCPGCRADVVIPREYLELVASRRAVAEHLPREAAALRRARIVGHPLFALVIFAAAYASLELVAVLFRFIVHDMAHSPDSVPLFLVAFPLLYVPVTLVFVALGQLLGGRTLARRIPSLAAVRDARGYACRGCGGPLGAARDGVAELCLYCGVQNVITAQMAAGAASATSVAAALADNIDAASASFWAQFHAFGVPLLYIVGVVGVILYPVALLIGLNT